MYIVTSFADGPITRLFQTKNAPLFPVYGEWGRQKGTMSPFFTVFVQEGFPKIMFLDTQVSLAPTHVSPLVRW